MKTTSLVPAACAVGIFACAAFAAPVSLSIDAAVSAKAISPYLYGKNGGLVPKGNPTSADTIQRYKDAGFKMLRLNDGNNGTKYNWEKRLSSHPDWYNNVYANEDDWDLRANDLATSLPGVQGLFGLSMLGWVANNTAHNFNDGLYNNYTWTTDANSDWAGTPAITAAGQKPTGATDPLLYLEKRTADQTLGIVDHFFGTQTGQLGLDSSQFLYWNMDNEPDMWELTHSDVMPDTMSAEEFVQIYVDMAVKARNKFPNIKLVGPVTTNEWMWYQWHSALVPYGGASYSFMEFFIKRIGEEQARTGKRLLDVVDYHFYPEYNAASDKANILQLHRVWFDTAYAYPKANGLQKAFPGTSKEFIFQRTRNWLTTYLGANHGVTLGMTECGGIGGASADASVIAAWYASQMGEFGSAGDVEIFTPWTQYPGMFEAVHLFTRYAKSTSLPSKADATNLVSAYPSLNAAKDSMTVILVNRNLTSDQAITVNLAGFVQGGTWAPTFDLANLSGETFRSEAVNGIYKNAVDVANGSFTITVPKVSVTAVVLSTANPGTKPTFVARILPSSSSSTTSSSSGATLTTTLVWDYTLGAQVKQPSGTAGGWWYNFADPLSTISAISAPTITTDKGLHVVFTGVQDATQNYNYAGLGFNWGTTAVGAALSTVNLSTYSQICVEYKSNVALKAGIGQTSATDATKATNYMTATEVLPIATSATTKCLSWSDFPAGAALNLTKQSAFQVQAGATADFTIYKISLVPKTITNLADRQDGAFGTQFMAKVVGSQLQLDLPGSGPSEVRIVDLQGHLVQSWSLKSTAGTQTLSLDKLRPGRYMVQVPQLGAKSILLIK